MAILILKVFGVILKQISIKRKHILTQEVALQRWFIAGYKHFFTPFLGLRAYINVNALHGSITMSGITYSGTQLKYGANVDFSREFYR